MRGSFQIARFAGINVYIHWTFWLLVVFIVVQAARAASNNSYGSGPLPSPVPSGSSANSSWFDERISTCRFSRLSEVTRAMDVPCQV